MRLFLMLFMLNIGVYASGLQQIREDYNPVVLLWLVAFIVLSRGLSIVKKFGIPLVVGEILAGVMIGDADIFGIHLFQEAENNIIINFLSEFGAIILMFEIGLESKLSDLKVNLGPGVAVAAVGSLLTFCAGYIISAVFIPHSDTKLNLLMGVILSATATGISMKVFKDMHIVNTIEVNSVLVTSIIDELVTILCFALISALILGQHFSFQELLHVLNKVMIFFIVVMFIARYIIFFIIDFATRIHAGINMKVGVLLIICLFFAWFAHALGLATVLGAFMAGLIVDDVYFKSFNKSKFIIQIRSVALQVMPIVLRQQLINLIDKHESHNLSELIKPISHLFVPVFFIHIGLMLNIRQFLQLQTIKLTILLLLVSLAIRVFSSYLVRIKNCNRLIIGFGMTPIGEAGLIFAVFGRNLNLINNEVLSSIVGAVVIAAILTPICVKIAIRFGDIHYMSFIKGT